MEINQKHYIICSEWYPQFREKLDKWIKEQETQVSDSKIDVYVLPKHNIKTCKKCDKKTLAEHLLLTYYKGEASFQKEFHIHKCENCNLIFMSEGTYNLYSNSSDTLDPNINFIIE